MDLGWLSPTGEFIKCNLMDHLFIAKEIADKLKYPVYDNAKDRMIHDDDRLYNHGWAHITRSLLGAHEYIINWTQHLTSEQKRYLRPIFEDNNISIDRISRFEWEEEENNEISSY